MKRAFCIGILSMFMSLGAAQRNVVFQDVCWSMDNKSVFFSCIAVQRDWSDFNPSNWNVGRCWVETGEIEILAQNAFMVSVFKKDREIIYGNRIGDRQDLLVKDLRTGDTRIFLPGGSDSAPAVSPNGRWVAFNRDVDGHKEVYVANRKGRKVKRLTESGEHHAYNPAWSPDGKRIVYYLEKGDGKDQIHTVSRKGDYVRQITDDQLNNIYPGYTFDGDILYSAGMASQPAKLMLYRSETGQIEPLLDIESFYARQSRDGEKLAYITGQADRKIVVINMTTGNVIQEITQESMMKHLTLTN